MATSGNKSISVATGLTLKFSWEIKSQDTANNKSVLDWKLELIAASNAHISSSASKAWTVEIEGKKFSGNSTVGIDYGKTKTLASSASSGTATVSHNADGTKTISYSFSQYFGINYGGSSLDTKSGSGTGTLTAIDRVSKVSATNAYVGEESTITITRYNSNFKHTLHYKYGKKDYIEISGGKLSGTSYPWYVPYDILENTKDAKKATITLKCTTYNGSTKIGESTTTFTANFKKSECQPYFYEPEVEDMNDKTVALTGDPTVLVKYFSTARVYSNPHTQYGAELTDTYISDDTTATVLDQVADFENVATDTFTLYAKDTRGFEKTDTLKASMINYVKLTCALGVSAPTADGNATLTVSGAGFGGNFGVVVNKPTIYIRLKTDEMSDYSNWEVLGTPTISSNKYVFEYPLTGLDYKRQYTFQVKIEDSLMSKTSKAISVKTAPIFDWSAEDFKFNVPVYMDTVKLAYTPGDTVAISHNSSFSGYLSNGRKSVIFSIPLDKPLVGVASVDISGSVNLRGITGYLYNQSSTKTSDKNIVNLADRSAEGIESYTFEITGQSIRVGITFKSAITADAEGKTQSTNNSPMAVCSQNGITLTFA